MCDCGGETYFGKKVAKYGPGLADRAQNAIVKRAKNWFGMGDYKIAANSIINSSGSSPAVIETKGRSVRVMNKEYLGEVYIGTGNDFYPTTYQINPGNVHTFPWLSVIANQFEQWQPNGIIFEFKSTATDTTTTASLGSCMMATDYDVKDPVFPSKSAMMNSAYSSESKMSNSMLHGLECDPGELQRNVFYVRPTGAVVDDIRDYDMAFTTIATQGGGLPDGQSVGSLYIHYDITFFKEQIGGGLANLHKIYAMYSAETSNVGTTREPGDLFANTANGTITLRAGIDMGIAVNLSDKRQIVIPRKWAGAAIHMVFICKGGISNSGGNQVVWTGGKPILPPKDGLLTWPFGPAYEDTFFYNIGRVTDAVNGDKELSTVECVFLVDEILTADAVIEIERLDTIPAGSVAALGYWLMEVVPRDYFELNTQ